MAERDDEATWGSATLAPQTGDADKPRLLVMVQGGVQEFDLPPGGTPFLLGRSPGAHIYIDDPSVSREHARVFADQRGVLVQDLGSRNGSFLNGVKLGPEPAFVQLGDAIRFGTVVAQLQGSRTTGRGGPRMIGAREFERRLNEEGDRCIRFDRSVALIAVEVEEPDEKRSALARSSMLAHLRAIDRITPRALGRLDVLIPECDKSSAGRLAERMAEAVRAGGVECRLGVAAYPGDVQSIAALAVAAQLALRSAEPGRVGMAREGARLLQIGSHEVVVAEPSMVRLFALIERAAATRASILVRGETGTGKEIVSEAIHVLGPRAGQPLVKINCAAMPEALLESELFGHERGAFSGAVAAKPGLFEQSSGGTLFLDEIGEMSLPLQAKLLRALEEGSVRRVGATKETPVDLRVVAATNVDLAAASETGRFRSDLYYRLSALEIEVPPLRERVREIPILVERFAAAAAAQIGAERIAVDRAAMTALCAHPWPGNVRELKNAVTAAAIAAEGGDTIQLHHLPAAIAGAAAPAPVPPPSPPSPPPAPATGTGMAALEEELREVERKHIRAALERAGGNQSRAAELLGIPRRTLVRKLAQLGIQSGRRRPAHSSAPDADETTDVGDDPE